MFFHFSGLSLLVHLLVIISAWIVNLVRGDKHSSVFQTYNKGGGIVKNSLLNHIISVGVLLLGCGYMTALFILAITTGLEIGATEPQVIFAKWLFTLLVSGIIMVLLDATFQVLVTALLIVSSFLFIYMNRLEIIHHFNVIKLLRVAPKLFQVPAQFTKVYLSKFSFLLSITAFLTNFVPLILGIVVGLTLFTSPLLANAQIVEPGFESEIVMDGLSLATAAAFTPDGRIFVAEKSGTVRVVKNGVLMPEPLVSLTDINTFGDRGLLGLAVDPNFTNNGYIYLSYTYENTPGLNIAGSKTGRIVRLTVDGDTADESSKLVLVGTVGGSATTPSCEDLLVTDDCIASDSNSHSVGGLRFGPDGKLYATLGDGADFVDVDPRALRAQNVDALAGKLLRINTDGTAPVDNPFYNGDPNSNRSKVYALGLRNAFRFNLHPVTGQLYVGDVGWSNWEEINLITAGGNYGWPCREGNFATSYGCEPSSTSTNPLYVYPHNASGAGSITAGAFPDNGVYPSSYDNSLFIGDYAQMWMKRLELSASGTAVVGIHDFNTDVFPVEIITGPDGNIYYIDIVFGTLNRLTHTSGNRHPVVVLSANPTSGLAPLTVAFGSTGTSDPDGNPITYAWSFGDGSVSTLAAPTHVYTVNNTYTASLVVTDSLGSSFAKSTTVLVGNQAPVTQITSPASGSLYNVGETITVTGEGFDPENGVMPPSAFSWEVVLHHNVHTHSIYQANGTTSITFPADDHSASDVYLEVILTVTDSAGLEDTRSINMYLNNGVGSGNLVSNSSLEIEGAISSSPLNWYQGWYGEMNPIFTYPVAGLAGDRAAQVEITSYVSGDAKWYFTPAFVTPGTEYTFTDLYTATVPSSISLQFGRSDGTYQYATLGTIPAALTPTRITRNFTVPAGIETVTIFHQINSVGRLVTDDYTLALAGTDVIAPTGNIASPLTDADVSGLVVVEVNAADNKGVASVQLIVNGIETGVGDSEPSYSIVWDTTALTDGAYTLSAQINDISGNSFQTDPVTVNVDNNNTTPVNLIQNGDFELVNVSNPLGWQPSGWGTHSSVFTYPVTGVNGSVAAEVTITNYDFGQTGDSKWQHEPVPVSAGTEYTYRTKYKATSISDIIGRYTFTDGSVHYFGLIKEIPAIAGWTQLEKAFVPPVGAETVTLFHLISSESTLTIDDVELYSTGTGTPSETNPPLIDFVSPTAGAVLSGTVTLVATSSDDTSVVGVYFAINGAPLGGEDATAPYQFVLNTNNYPDGTYVLKATTHDPFGNNDKKEITVTFDNTNPPVATSTNLVINHGLETPGTAGNPASWNRGGWGTNTRTFTYPATGYTGNAVSVTISGYTNGDAKWFFNDVAVTPGTEYTITDRYNSTVGSEALIRYTTTSGTNQYQFLQTLPATSGTWTTMNRTFTPPAGVVSMTLFHLIAGNGTLTIDDMSVTGPGATSTPDIISPTVSVTAPSTGATVSGTTTITATANDNIAVAGVTFLIDGVPVSAEDTTAPYSFVWNTASVTNGTHTILALARDTSSNIATSTVVNVTVSNTITPPTGNNLVLNPALETPGTAGNPANWNRGGWGTNNRAYTYPVAGITGNAAQVEITTYTNGDAKWFFDPVAVTGGTEYTVGDKYNSTVTTELLVRYTLTGGTFQYQFLTQLPATLGAWNTFSQVITAPTNAIAVTLFHVLIGNGRLVVDDAIVLGAAVNPPVDTTLPTVSITSPLTGTIASGTVTVQATANDNVGVAGVTLLIDSVVVGTEDTTSPYTFSWNSTLVTNGIHTISARARDTSNNTADAALVSITVNNSTTTPPTGNNLVLNSALETAGIAGNPANWNRGGWGTNDRTFTYPVAGQSGNGARIAMTTYTNGDAKWYFDEVVVNPGQQYTFSYAYKASVPSNITLRYTRPDGTYSYVGMGNPAASANWTTGTLTITPPTGVTALTVMHILTQAGVLEIDNQVLSTGNANTLARGKVTFSFDDGWIEHATVAAPILNAANIDGTFYIISNEVLAAVPTERLQNSTLATSGGNGDPANWKRGGWGSNDRTFTYPVAGVSDSAAQVTVTNYVNGDAKWYFDDVTVLQNFNYTVKGRYQSDTPTELLIRHLLTDGNYAYQFLGNLPATGTGNWATYEFTFFTPVNAASLTIFHVLAQNGTLITDDLSLLQKKLYADTNQVLAMQAAGHEIGSHTRTHPSLVTLNAAQKTDEIVNSKTSLEAEGLNISTIAYPFGAYDDSVKTLVANSGYTLGRSVDRGFNDLASDPYALRIQQVGRNTNLAQQQSWVDQAAQNDVWLIFMFHQISNDQAANLGITEGEFTELVNYVKAADVDIITIEEGASLLQ